MHMLICIAFSCVCRLEVLTGLHMRMKGSGRVGASLKYLLFVVSLKWYAKLGFDANPWTHGFWPDTRPIAKELLVGKC